MFTRDMNGSRVVSFASEYFAILCPDRFPTALMPALSGHAEKFLLSRAKVFVYIYWICRVQSNVFVVQACFSGFPEC